ncbi:MAG: TonB-dependent receptor, partial [Opitutaceae bacterium]|nr:TonB-dependent receptor [Opitutaceae bacterium]
QSTNIGQTRDNRPYMPTLTWHPAGGIWTAAAGLGHSHARAILRGFDRGFFNTVSAQRTGVTVSFADIFYLRPNRITVTDAAGAAVDPHRIDTYAITSTAGNYVRNSDQQRTAYAHAQRAFGRALPITLKGGLDVRQSQRDLSARNQPFTFASPAAPFLDEEVSRRIPPYGFPATQWISNHEVWQAYRQTPARFVANEDADYRSTVSGSKFIEETVSSAYLRGDMQLLDRRLRLVGGLRAEQTNVEGQGPLTDATRNFRRDAAGRPILGANNRPLTIATAPLEISRLTFISRGAQTEKEYLRLFPSLNANWTARENLIVRAAVYESVGRPDLNQYAGGITLPDTSAAPGPANRITVNNAGIKAWSARTTSVRVEHYFEGVGSVSVGAFRRHIENFFGAIVRPATPDFLALYGLDDATYGGFDVATQENLTEGVRMEGLDFGYKQALTFLPPWARGVQVFANASAQRALGDVRGNFAGYIPRSASWGVSLARERYNLRANWSYRSRSRRNAVAVGPGVEPGTFNWASQRLSYDLDAEYRLSRRFALFANLRNVGDATDDTELAGPNTPPAAQFRSRLDNGSLWTFGVKGSF